MKLGTRGLFALVLGLGLSACGQSHDQAETFAVHWSRYLIACDGIVAYPSHSQGTQLPFSAISQKKYQRKEAARADLEERRKVLGEFQNKCEKSALNKVDLDACAQIDLDSFNGWDTLHPIEVEGSTRWEYRCRVLDMSDLES